MSLRAHTYIHQSRSAHPAKQTAQYPRVRGVGGGCSAGYAPRTLLYEYLSQFSRTKLHALSAAFTGANFLQAAASSSFPNLFGAPFSGPGCAAQQTF